MPSFANIDACCHAFAHATHLNGRSGNVSYSAHGPLSQFFSWATTVAERHVRPDGRIVFLVSDQTHSPRTAVQMGKLRRAIRGNGDVYTVHYLTQPTGWARAIPRGLHVHDLNVLAMLDDAAASMTTAGRARKYAVQHTDRAARLLDDARRYAHEFGLTFVVPATLADVGAWTTERAARLAEMERAEQARTDARTAETRAEWRNGIGASAPGSVMLRAYANAVETSRSACVPMADARRLYVGLVTGAARVGMECGAYRLDAIGATSVTLGCHEIDYAEIARFAQAQAWTVTHPVPDAWADAALAGSVR